MSSMSPRGQVVKNAPDEYASVNQQSQMVEMREM